MANAASLTRKPSSYVSEMAPSLKPIPSRDSLPRNLGKLGSRRMLSTLAFTTPMTREAGVRTPPAGSGRSTPGSVEKVEKMSEENSPIKHASDGALAEIKMTSQPVLNMGPEKSQSLESFG